MQRVEIKIGPDSTASWRSADPGERASSMVLDAVTQNREWCLWGWWGGGIGARSGVVAGEE